MARGKGSEKENVHSEQQNEAAIWGTEAAGCLGTNTKKQDNPRRGCRRKEGKALSKEGGGGESGRGGGGRALYLLPSASRGATSTVAAKVKTGAHFYMSPGSEKKTAMFVK